MVVATGDDILCFRSKESSRLSCFDPLSCLDGRGDCGTFLGFGGSGSSEPAAYFAMPISPMIRIKNEYIVYVMSLTFSWKTIIPNIKLVNTMMEDHVPTDVRHSTALDEIQIAMN